MVAGIDELEVLAFFPADHAEVVAGKVYANGAFWTVLRFPSYPQMMPSVSLVAVLSVPPHAFGVEHMIAIGMMDSDGAVLPMRAEGQFRVDGGPDLRAGESAVMAIAVTVSMLRLDRPDDLSFRLFVDGEELDRYRFRAVQIAPSRAAGGQAPA